MNQQQYPMEGIAEQLANQGRYGDTMLMHVNPAEVEGIASLVPGGLPRNPMTGQPEAFIGMILSMIAKPLLTKGVAALGAKAGAGALGSALTGLAGSSAAMTGLTSGLIETARTGDIKKGFASGLMGAGIGKALGAATDAVNEGVGTATENLEGLTKDLTATEETIKGLKAIGGAGTDLTQNQLDALRLAEAGKESLIGGAKIDLPLGGTATDPGSISMARDALQDARIAANQSYGSMGDVFKPGGFKAGVDAVMSPEGFLPLALGASQRAELDYQDAMDAEGRRRDEEKAAEEQASRDLMEQSFSDIRRDYPEMRNEYNPYAMAQGGIISIDPSQYAQTLQGLSDVAGPINMEAGGRAEFEIAQSYPSVGAKGGAAGMGGGYNAGGAKSRQSQIRGATLVKPGEGYRPGFDAEHRFFQNIKKETDPAPVTPRPSPPDYTVPGFPDFPEGENISLPAFVRGGEDFAIPGGMEGAGEIFPMMGGNKAQQKAQQILEEDLPAKRPIPTARPQEDLASAIGVKESIMNDPYISDSLRETLSNVPDEEFVAMREKVLPKQEVADVAAIPRLDPNNRLENPYNFTGGIGGSIGMQEGGLAELAAQATAEPSVDDAQYGQLIEQTAMALLGQVSEEEAEIIINRFIDEFGQEAFQMLREQVLQGVVPDAQTQGLVEGEGGGMDDQVQGMIGDQQRVAVSPGEFIVPADVVSGLGDGDTSAGADELDDMMERVRVERTGTPQQPPRLSAGGLLPA